MPHPPSQPATALLAYATQSILGCGGELRATPEDFIVDEEPAYMPMGEGEHLYLHVQKRLRSTADVGSELARLLGLSANDVGYAGRKDHTAVTRQWFSLHTARDPDPETLQGQGWRTLSVSRHGNKLRLGHLSGNRFSLILRNLGTTDQLSALMAHISTQGVPNYFGPQRVGDRLQTAWRGRSLVHQQRSTRFGLNQHRFLVNAYQSLLFNSLLSARLERLGTLATLLPGDLAILHRNGAAFRVHEAELGEAQQRAELGEISPSAPLFGYRSDLADGQPGQWERSLLAAEGIDLSTFRLGGKRTSPKGERRPLRAFPRDLTWRLTSDCGDSERQTAQQGQHLHLAFTLPAGCYATALLREITKSDGLHGFAVPGVSSPGPISTTPGKEA